MRDFCEISIDTAVTNVRNVYRWSLGIFLDLTEKGLIGSQIRSSNTAIKHTKLMRPSIVYMIVVCLAIYG